MNTITQSGLRLPAQYARLDTAEMTCVDGGLSINPLNWFKNISMSVTITWNGGALATQFPTLAWLFKQLALNLKFTLT